MSRGRLTDEEVKILGKNPYIKSVTYDRIQYTREFKRHFMREYLAGKGPTRIFREAGFDTEILGYKRIERATAHWKEAYHAGRLEDTQDAVYAKDSLLHNSKPYRKKMNY